ncbi:MAG: 2OG-Fe(II) oxygenase [Candidatus Xenobia bacterium]
MPDFIETYDEALSGEVCDLLIAHFEASPRRRTGATGQGVDKAKKNSTDINISRHAEWAEVEQQIAERTWQYLVLYMRKYVYMLVGALVLGFPDPDTGQIRNIDADLLPRLNDVTVMRLIRHMYRFGTINLQKYSQGEGGYPHWHSEIYPQANDPECDALHRVLLFMYYLNDVAEGGETEFFYQERKLRPTRGQLVIAPSGFTHTHRGNVPLSSDKYILTSWVLYQPAAKLYGS